MIKVFDQQRPWHRIRHQRKSEKEKRRIEEGNCNENNEEYKVIYTHNQT